MKTKFILVLIFFLSNIVNAYSLTFCFSSEDSCNVSIVQHDTIIYSNDAINFQLNTNNQADYYIWHIISNTNNVNISDSLIRNPIVTIQPNTTQQIVLEAYYYYEDDSNYVLNGDFELGDTGFFVGSDLIPVTYSVSNNANTNNPGNCSCSNSTNILTTRIRSHWISGTELYRQNLSIEPNAHYVFSFDATTVNQNITVPEEHGVCYSIFNYSYFFNGLSQPQNYWTSSDVSLICCDWQHFFLPFYADNYTDSIRINIGRRANAFIDWQENSFDNISVRKVCATYDTINITIIKNNSERFIDTTICENAFPFHYYDSIYNSPELYYHYFYSSESGFDSIHYLTIRTYGTTYRDTIIDYFCIGSIYNGNGFYNIMDTGLYFNTYINSNGCDSVIYLRLKQKTLENKNIYITICEGGTYSVGGFNASEEGIYYDTIDSYQGCDSVIILHLNLIPALDTVIEATINTSQIYEEYGFHLTVGGIYYTYFQFGDGCKMKIKLILNVIEKETIDVWFPNSFTPSQSSNTVFKYYTQDYDNIRIKIFQIFNRWGQEIFSTQKKAVFWDGKYKGKDCPTGTYVWRLLYFERDNGRIFFEKKGEVNLIR